MFGGGLVQRTWSLPQPSGQTGKLVGTLGLSPTVAGILVQRGIERVDQVVEFLCPSRLNLASPFCFQDMERAMTRLQHAHELQEKVLVYGDYDVDGVTSVTLLYRVLTDIGVHAVAYIPHRLEEGYGLNREAVEKAHSAGVKMIITVDCGITAVEEIAYAQSLGIDVIVTDHHEPPEVLPEALAIINPKADKGYPFRELAGVGVAFKLAQALLGRFGDKGVSLQAEQEILDLVALGTIADVVPLVGENRILVKAGLKQMEQTVHTGLQALLEVCGLSGKKLKAGQVAFILAPRINAVGRMDSARTGLELLLTGNPAQAAELARRLSQQNQMRQETEKQILSEAIAQLEQEVLPRVIVLSSPNWHHGVIGIVASRLVERYYRPVFLIAEDGEEGKGSARGIPGYHVLEQLTLQKEHLQKFGGHRQAAGFSLARSGILGLREGLNRAAERFPDSLYQASLRIDNLVRLDELGEGLLTELEQMAPFGFGNPGPTLAAFGVPLASVSTVGQESHLKFRFGNQGEWEGVFYRQGGRLAFFQALSHLDVAFGLELNVFRGEKKLQLVIQDAEAVASRQERTVEDPSERARAVAEMSEGMPDASDEKRESGTRMSASGDSVSELAAGIEQVAVSVEGVASVMLAQSDPQARAESWKREKLVEMYRALRSLAAAANPFAWSALPRQEWEVQAIKIFEELGLIRCLGGTNPWQLELLPVSGKLDLESSLRLRALRRKNIKEGF